MRKHLLLAPGPTPVPPEVLLKMAEPMIHHRTPQFSQTLAETGALLRELYQTEQPVLMLSGSGTAGMEAIVANLVGPGEKALVVRGGKFGERWGKLIDAHQGIPVYIDVEWGEAVTPAAVEAKLKEDKDIVAVFVQACETSTATEMPIEALAKVVRAHGDTLFCVDGITGVGCFPLPMDAWGIDALVCGSQKALQLPPGMATVGLSERAWAKAGKTKKVGTFYLDLAKEKKALVEERSTAWTAPVTLVHGLNMVLKDMLAEGLDKVFARQARLAEATRTGLAAMGLPIYSKAPSRSVTAAWTPEGVDGSKLFKYLRDTVGVTLAGGQDKLKGKVIRIGHMGYVDTLDIVSALAAVELALDRIGHKVDFGKGPGAAMAVLKEGYPR